MIPQLVPNHFTLPERNNELELSPRTSLATVASVRNVDERTLKAILRAAKQSDVEDILYPPHVHGQSPQTSRSDHNCWRYLGRVCRAWHSVMQSDPTFWNRIIAFVDIKYTPECAGDTPIHTFVRLSNDLPLFVYFVRKVPYPPSLDLQEYSTIKDLMKPLWEQMHRIERLVIHANHSSSLPCASEILYGRPTYNLKQLVMIANGEDSIFCRTRLPLATSPVPTYMSQLVDLRIDGYSLLILLKPEVTFNLISAFPELQVLFITSLTYRVDGFTMDKINLFLLNVVPTLFKLTTLVLDTFGVPISTATCPPHMQSLVKSLSVKKTEGPSLQYLLYCLSPVELYLDRCHITTP
ncbi:hypothetical protein NMY22_g7308 [Coprinellus aureogranulatus]|nr:hypothetical protein NMY22_g7308 [Coprinellus aureogranulatus]